MDNDTPVNYIAEQFKEIARKISNDKDAAIALAFVERIYELLTENGILPRVNYIYDDADFTTQDNEMYIIQKISFDLDTTEHDNQVRAEAHDVIKAECQKEVRSETITDVIEMLVNDNGYSPHSATINDIRKLKGE